MSNEIISNEKINEEKLDNAINIITNLQQELLSCIESGCGPFLAAIYDKNNNLIAKSANSVVSEKCSNNHAEINTIKLAQNKLQSYDLSSFDLSIYVTAEPCMMCLGAIMWSGIKNLYYGVPSKIVEEITGFDEGFKPNWLDEFKKRGIIAYGNIVPDIGIEQLKKYVNSNREIYKPSR